MLLALIAANVNAQFKTRIYNMYSDIPLNHQITYNNITYQSNEFCAGGNVCVGNKILNTIAEYNFHKVNLSNVVGAGKDKIYVHEFLVGLRFYAAKPTFMLSRTALRFTAGCKGGWDIDLNPRSMFFAGFGITGVRNPSGILVEGFYHQSKNGSQGFMIEPYYGIRLGFVLGPTSE